VVTKPETTKSGILGPYAQPIRHMCPFSLLYFTTKEALETHELTLTTIVSNNKDFREFEQCKIHECQPEHGGFILPSELFGTKHFQRRSLYNL